MKHTFYARRVLPAGRCATAFLSQFRLRKKRKNRGSPTFLKFSINLDVLWRLQPLHRLRFILGSRNHSQLSMCLDTFMSYCHAFHAFTNVCFVASVPQFVCFYMTHSLSLAHVKKKRKKKGGEKVRGAAEGDSERLACRVTFCLGGQAIVRLGRQHQSLALHRLVQHAHTHTHTHTLIHTHTGPKEPQV